MYLNLDEHEAIRHAEIEGAIALGKEQGMLIGLEQGRELGFQRGQELGLQLAIEQVATKMLRNGISPEKAAKHIGCSLEIIEKIQKSNMNAN